MIDGLPFSSEGYNQAKSILVGKYRKPSEVANTHIRSFMTLPTIHNTNPKNIYDFYERPIAHINTLDTMSKLKEISGYVGFTLDKLCDVTADLVRTDDNWQNWELNELIGAICKWTERNSIERLERLNRPFKEQYRRECIMQTRQDTKTRQCVYCGSKDYKAIACNRIQDINKRRKIISSKGLCFNCTGEGHCASSCKSQRSCMKCKGNHHTSLCMDETNHKLPEQGPIIQLQGRNSLPHQRVKLSTRLL